MTAAQKKNVERFKKAAAEAKKLRNKNPKLTQAQAVKQAFAILYKTGKVAGAKKTATKKPARKKATAKSYHKDTKSHNVRISVVSGVKKKVGYSKERIQAHKELTKAIKSQPKELFPYTKKQTIIKGGKKYFDEMAKKLHSVGVMGAISDSVITTIKEYDKKREKHEKEYKFWRENAKIYGKGKNNPSLKHAREHKSLVTYYTNQIKKLRLKIK